MILSLAELRQHVNTGLGDDALTRLLDAAESAIVTYAGAAGQRVEYIDGGSRFITTLYPIDTIGQITETRGETVTTLASDDYLHRSAYVLERLRYGTNPASAWCGRVAITYTPTDDASIRATVQIDLVNAALAYQPGLSGQTIGDWSEHYFNDSDSAAEREAILARLRPDGAGMWVI